MAERELRLFDTASHQIKALQTIEPGHLRFYSCGPTVYSYAHIGNFRTFLTADLVVRTALALGWKVSYVSNITDVGHLTIDDVADASGEDKMEGTLHSKEGERFHNIWEVSDFYEQAFRDDWKLLNLLEPTVRPRATQHMREQILAAQLLVRQSNAYETPTGVYFNVNSFKEYGKLSGNTLEKLKKAVRDVVVDDNKREQVDFALWKKDSRHLMQWFSPFDWGFPGWHLECSVMARAYLGDTIDLHGGGEDLIFPHHECEIAQSESLTGKPFCNQWIHTRFLLVNGEKMSKSLGNYFTVRDILGRGIDPLALRYVLITGSFTSPFNFTEQGLKDAVANVQRLRQAKRTAEQAATSHMERDGAMGSRFQELYDEALDAMCNNLNTSVALAKALEGAKLVSGSSLLSAAVAREALVFFERINALLGIIESESGADGEPSFQGGPVAVDEAKVASMIEARSQAKKAKDFGQADAIRAQLLTEGIELRDTPEGTDWVVKAPSI